jgi:hypothetical protein
MIVLKFNSVRFGEVGLTAAMKQARLDSTLAYRHWTLEDWKKVIWTDETSVSLGHRRGTTWVWRRTGENMDPTVVQRGWKKATEFMFWGCFSYDHKGLCHIWRRKTAEEKRREHAILDGWNELREPERRQRWEDARLLIHLSRGGRERGQPAQWRFTKANDKLVREAKRGGIDWLRYLFQVVVPKNFPIAERCKET